MRTCVQCHEPIPAERTASAKYCSARCCQTAARNNNTTPCSLDGCTRTVRARGLCGSHYNQTHAPDRHPKKLMACAWCGAEVLKYTDGRRKYGPVCSEQCRQWLATPYCKLPDDHWARWYGKSSTWTPPMPDPKRFVCNTCNECGIGFVEVNPHNVIANYSRYCSEQCQARVSRRTRKAREHNAPGNYRWIEVIRLWVAAGKRCSYCDIVMSEQPDPDHVIPLSRGGRNDMGNIVACCHMCNSDKCDLTLDEWAHERMRLGKPRVRTALDVTDARFRHLTLDVAQGVAWRHQLAA